MWIASIAYKESACATEHAWKMFGKLWYSKDEHRASILLHGFRAGSYVARPYANVKEAPYLCGEIVVWTGEYNDVNGIQKKRYMHVGHIQSADTQKGVTYYGDLRIDPMPCVMIRQIGRTAEKIFDGENSNGQTGIYLNVFLDDREAKK